MFIHKWTQNVNVLNWLMQDDFYEKYILFIPKSKHFLKTVDIKYVSFDRYQLMTPLQATKYETCNAVSGGVLEVLGTRIILAKKTYI